MNSPTHTKDLQTKHKTKVKRHWVYDPETGEEQELMFTDPLGEPVKESNGLHTLKKTAMRGYIWTLLAGNCQTIKNQQKKITQRAVLGCRVFLSLPKKGVIRFKS